MQKKVRCAIYTRKSSEEGLDQTYNSLDAQRDACAAYVLSQAGEGWTLLPEAYNDGGFSGGTMERPALKRLLAEIHAGRIDVVVVYKVDRLTRALGDFSRIIETLDGAGASFVSVTQAFNTTTSMGRLTLNVLLSFAQFEREVTGERIRDKIAASKKRGMWMGGGLPLGYRASGRTLEIVPEEAETVRMIFERYLEVGSVHGLRDELHRRGILSKRTVAKNGAVRGGTTIERGALFHLLRNRTYLGEIPHKDVSYPGQHPAIITRDLFEGVQQKLDETATILRRPSAQIKPQNGAPLTGLIFDTAGHPMSPTAAQRPNGAKYRYYVSKAIQSGEREKAGACPRAPASLVETILEERLTRLGLIEPIVSDWTAARRAIERVEVSPERLTIRLALAAVQQAGGAPWVERQLLDDEQLVMGAHDQIKLLIDVKLARQGMRTIAISPTGGRAIDRREIDEALTVALIRAEAWKRKMMSGEYASVGALAKDEGVLPTYVSRVVRVAFLAPELKRSILDGKQPRGLSLQAIMTRDLPLAWSEQRVLFAA